MILKKCVWAGIVVFCLCLQLGCGKVVQESARQEEVKSSDMVYQVSGYGDVSIFSQVSGVDSVGKWSELSWGRGELKSVVDKAGAKSFFSVAYRKDGQVISGGADHTWTKLLYEPKSKQWSGDSRKIRLGYMYYLVSVFSDSSSYSLRVLESKVVSQDRMIQLGSIDPYDTFLSVLFLNLSRVDRSFVEKTGTLVQLERVFSKPFFAAIKYVPPKNKVEKFSSLMPAFELSGDVEKSLMTIFQMTLVDTNDAIQYVEKLNVPWLSKDAKKQLSTSIKSFRK
jgi:hypothetical protein